MLAACIRCKAVMEASCISKESDVLKSRLRSDLQSLRRVNSLAGRARHARRRYAYGSVSRH